MKLLSDIRNQVNDWESIENRIDSVLELWDLVAKEGDQEIISELIYETKKIQEILKKLEFQLILSGTYDNGDALLALHAGAGGVDSQDWAAMLVRMYTRWGEKRNFKIEMIDVSYGEETGIKTAVIQMRGAYAYGYLKAEKGVHRLVRISPFDNAHARHTSFALAEVLPFVDHSIEIEINQDDLRIDVFRAGGHGGQSVQKNSTAIRITHIPSGIVVTCQNERSQRQNKEIAMRVLTSRLMELEEKKKDAKLAELKGDHISAEWGNQIRSYVLHPYHMVKDHRTSYESSNTDAVLDGEIDEFIMAYLTSIVGDNNINDI